jgi:hypothetical protein
MIEITEDGKKIYTKGDPPPAGREWRSFPAVMHKLGVNRNVVWYHIRRHGWTIYRQNQRRTWILKEDVDSYLNFIEVRKRWYKGRKPKTWREEVCTDVDEETCKCIFWTAEQAALYMGVRRQTIYRWGQKGKIPVFVTSPKGTARRTNWYSPSSLRHMTEDLDHLKQRAKLEKARQTMQAGIVDRQVYKLRHKPCVYRKPIPAGWLSVRQAAERLDISRAGLLRLQQRGRLRGKQYYKGKLEDMSNWMEKDKTRCHWFFHEDDIEALKNDERYQILRDKGKAVATRRPLPRRPTYPVSQR